MSYLMHQRMLHVGIGMRMQRTTSVMLARELTGLPSRCVHDPTRQLVLAAFRAIDSRSRKSGQGAGDGQLTLDDLRDMCECLRQKHASSERAARSGLPQPAAACTVDANSMSELPW